MDPITLTAIALGTGAVNSIFNRQTSKRDAILNRRFDREMADLAWQRDLEMWNMNNQYNNPVSQMQRLKAAGLNPNLVYGSGSVGNTSGSMPKYQSVRSAHRTEPYQVPNLAEYQGAMMMQQAQLDNVREQNNLLKAKGVGEELNNAKKAIGIKQGELDFKLSGELFETSVEYKRMQVKKALKDIEAVTSNISNIQQRTETEKQKTIKAKADALLSQHKEELARFGIYSSDHIILRLLVQKYGNDYSVIKSVLPDIFRSLTKPVY